VALSAAPLPRAVERAAAPLSAAENGGGMSVRVWLLLVGVWLLAKVIYLVMVVDVMEG
jgi:hypothetical protein